MGDDLHCSCRAAAGRFLGSHSDCLSSTMMHARMLGAKKHDTVKYGSYHLWALRIIHARLKLGGSPSLSRKSEL